MSGTGVPNGGGGRLNMKDIYRSATFLQITRGWSKDPDMVSDTSRLRHCIRWKGIPRTDISLHLVLGPDRSHRVKVSRLTVVDLFHKTLQECFSILNSFSNFIPFSINEWKFSCFVYRIYISNYVKRYTYTGVLTVGLLLHLLQSWEFRGPTREGQLAVEVIIAEKTGNSII